MTQQSLDLPLHDLAAMLANSLETGLVRDSSKLLPHPQSELKNCKGRETRRTKQAQAHWRKKGFLRKPNKNTMGFFRVFSCPKWSVFKPKKTRGLNPEKTRGFKPWCGPVQSSNQLNSVQFKVQLKPALRITFMQDWKKSRIISAKSTELNYRRNRKQR